jgi:hypothetical protein
MWKQFFKMCVCACVRARAMSNPTSVLRPIRTIACGHSVWEMPEGVPFFSVLKTAFRGIFQDGILSKCITKLCQLAAPILYILTESHVWLEVRLRLLQFVPVRSWREYYLLLYYCRAYVLTQSQKSVCPQKFQYIIPVLFELRPSGPFRPARHFKSNPWRHLNRVYSTYYIRAHVVRSAGIFHKLSELVSYHKFQCQLCITYVTGIGIMQPVDPLPSKHSSCLNSV